MLILSSCDKVASVGNYFSILWSGWFTTHLHTYLFVPESFVILETVLLYDHLYAALLLHFINTVTILAVVLHIYIPYFRVKLICRFTTVYTGWLE